MFRSVFLRRIIFVMLMALCLCAILASILFILLTQNSGGSGGIERVEKAAYDSFQEDAKSILLTKDPYALNRFSSNSTHPDLYLLLYDERGELEAASENADAIQADLQVTLQGYWDSTQGAIPKSKLDIKFLPASSALPEMIFLRIPIENDHNVLGELAVLTPVSDNDKVQEYLFEIILLATLIVSFLVLIPIFWATSRLLKPLHQVILAARTMAQGDLRARAEVHTHGEIGELAQSFNDLADKLSTSINELTVERNRLLNIFDVLSDGVISVDSNLEPVYANPTLHAIFESEKRNLKSNHSKSLQLIPFEDVWSCFKRSLLEGTMIHDKIRSRGKTYLFRIVPNTDPSGKATGAIGFFRDISESERLEQTRREYVANVSHELRTPLTALQGLIEPLADGMVKKEEDRMRYYGIILNETIRLSRLISDLMELSSLQAKTVGFETSPIDLNEFLKGTELKFQTIAQTASLDLSLEFPQGAVPLVEGNPDRLEQIMVILLDNATKYTPAGGKVTISTVPNWEENEVLVSVIDTGIGIEEKDLDYIFDRFYKADRARGKKGTGLGLAIAKELLEYMGERIFVESEYGKGTTFTFSLRCYKVESQEDNTHE